MSFTHFDGSVRPTLSDTARNTTFDQIPIISLKAPTAQLIDAIRDACTRVGFFYISDHGVPQSIIDSALENAEKFFSQTSHAKDEVHARKSKTMRGYQPMEMANPDLREIFAWGYEKELDPNFQCEDGSNQGCE
jgi:isopenicillin N synthase-like dioxygenase